MKNYPYPLGCHISVIHDSREDDRKFLHDTAIVEYNGALITAWYSCPDKEISENTAIVGRKSLDGGKSWQEPFVIVRDDGSEDGIRHFVPLSFLKRDGSLFAIISKMISHDRPVSVGLYKLINFDTDEWEWVTDVFSESDGLSVIVNGNEGSETPDGDLVFGGRFARGVGKYPDTPCVITSRGGNILDWTLVPLSDSPVGNCPETVTTLIGSRLVAFTRNPNGVKAYESLNYGKSWSEKQTNLPTNPVKIFPFTLTTGKTVVAFNVSGDLLERSRLCLAEIDDNLLVKKIYTLAVGDFGLGNIYHYPCVIESNGKLLVTCTVGAGVRSAVLISIPIESI